TASPMDASGFTPKYSRVIVMFQIGGRDAVTCEDKPRRRDGAVRGEAQRRPFGVDRDGVVFTVTREAHRIVLRQHHLGDEGKLFQITVAPLSVVTAFEIGSRGLRRAAEFE